MKRALDRSLWVRFGGLLVGHLRAAPSGRMAFTYDEKWLHSPAAFAISVSLPMRAAPHVGGAAHAFFTNLLPEGGVRQAVCRRLGISNDNDFALLAAIGGECAGALSVVEQGVPPAHPRDYEYELLSDRRLQALVDDDRVVPLLVGGATTRLSLAGAQDKLPVALLDGQIHLPLASAPSTHILKLPSARFKHIAANEAYVTGLAALLGFDVVSAELVQKTDPPSLLVERYDRRRTQEPWPAIRLHQEDLCQALGLPPTRKYEQEGGPTLVDVIELVRSQVQNPLLDVRRMIEWQAFNLAAGNSDGHAKNLSLLFGAGGPRLAPFYDLLSTRAYAGLDRGLAMGVGDRRDPDRITGAQWSGLGVALRIRPAPVIELVRSVAQRCLQALDDWTTAFRDRHGKVPVLQTLPEQIAKRSRRILRAVQR